MKLFFAAVLLVVMICACNCIKKDNCIADIKNKSYTQHCSSCGPPDNGKRRLFTPLFTFFLRTFLLFCKQFVSMNDLLTFQLSGAVLDYFLNKCNNQWGLSIIGPTINYSPGRHYGIFAVMG